MPLVLVAPGGSPKSKAQQGIATTSGHIIYLMPGDECYDCQEIPVVVVWNGLNHYSPTYPSHGNSILKWKCSLINRHISHAINLFGEIESDENYQEDIELSQCFHSLMSKVKETQVMLESKGVANVALPSTHIGPDPRDVMKTMTRTTPLPKHPMIFTKGGMSADLEAVADVASASDDSKPFIPVFTSSLEGSAQGQRYGGPEESRSCDSRTAETSVVTTYRRSIVSSKEEREQGTRVFPGFPMLPGRVTPVKQDFSFPLGEYMEVKRKLLCGLREEHDPEDTGGELLNPPALPLLEPENKDSYFTHPPLPTPLLQPSKPITIPAETTTIAPTKPITVTPKSITAPTLFIQKLKSIPKTTLPSFIPTFLPLSSQASSQSDFQTQPPPPKPTKPSSEPVRFPPIASKSSQEDFQPTHKQPGLRIAPVRFPEEEEEEAAFTESSQPTSAQPPAASKEGDDDDVQILDMGDTTLPHTGESAVFPSAIPKRPTVPKGATFSGAIPVHPAPKKTTAKQSLIVSLPMFPVQQRSAQSSLPPAVQSLVSQVVASVSPVVSASSSGSSGASARSSKPLQIITCPQPNCTYSTYNKGDYKIHKDKHLGIRYKCGSCTKDFGSHKARQTHFRTTHLGQHRSLCAVPECNFSHNDHGITKVHMYNAHGIGEEPKCLHADCVNRPNFTNFRVFDRHRQNYHVAKDTQCPHCQKMYKGVENLASHIKSLHSHLPSHQCDQCGLFYASKKTLKTHQETQH